MYNQNEVTNGGSQYIQAKIINSYKALLTKFDPEGKVNKNFYQSLEEFGRNEMKDKHKNP